MSYLIQEAFLASVSSSAQSTRLSWVFIMNGACSSPKTVIIWYWSYISTDLCPSLAGSSLIKELPKRQFLESLPSYSFFIMSPLSYFKTHCNLLFIYFLSFMYIRECSLWLGRHVCLVCSIPRASQSAWTISNSRIFTEWVNKWMNISWLFIIICIAYTILYIIDMLIEKRLVWNIRKRKKWTLLLTYENYLFEYAY